MQRNEELDEERITAANQHSKDKRGEKHIDGKRKTRQKPEKGIHRKKGFIKGTQNSKPPPGKKPTKPGFFVVTLNILRQKNTGKQDGRNFLDSVGGRHTQGIKEGGGWKKRKGTQKKGQGGRESTKRGERGNWWGASHGTFKRRRKINTKQHAWG